MLLTMILMVCPTTELIGFDHFTEIDKINIDLTMKRCPQKFPKSPCLKKFYKRGFQTYWAVCGRPEPSET
jgi:hypothetical protein